MENEVTNQFDHPSIHKNICLSMHSVFLLAVLRIKDRSMVEEGVFSSNCCTCLASLSIFSELDENLTSPTFWQRASSPPLLDL